MLNDLGTYQNFIYYLVRTKLVGDILNILINDTFLSNFKKLTCTTLLHFSLFPALCLRTVMKIGIMKFTYQSIQTCYLQEKETAQ